MFNEFKRPGDEATEICIPATTVVREAFDSLQRYKDSKCAHALMTICLESLARAIANTNQETMNRIVATINQETHSLSRVHPFCTPKHQDTHQNILHDWGQEIEARIRYLHENSSK